MHEEIGMPHIRLHRMNRLCLIPAIDIAHKLHVVAYCANISLRPNSYFWTPEESTTYLVNTMVRHLDPIGGYQSVSVHTANRVCPFCECLVPEPIETHVLVKVKCVGKFN
jgi:hypothetical protein